MPSICAACSLAVTTCERFTDTRKQIELDNGGAIVKNYGKRGDSHYFVISRSFYNKLRSSSKRLPLVRRTTSQKLSLILNIDSRVFAFIIIWKLYYFTICSSRKCIVVPSRFGVVLKFIWNEAGDTRYHLSVAFSYKISCQHFRANIGWSTMKWS